MTSVPRGLHTLYWTFLVLLGVHAMGAYSFLGVPIQWMALVGFIVLAFWIVSRQSLQLIPGFSLFLIFGLWAVFVGMVNMASLDTAYLVPEKATTDYFTYLILRFITIGACLAVAICAFWFCQQVGLQTFVEHLANLGVVVSLYSFYIYVAQVYGLPEPSRTRIGTDGINNQVTVFTYAFHRAMGSFREPSHLAEWLCLPFCLSMISKRFSVIKSFIILAAIFLSGSLTGIVSIAAALVISSFLHLNQWAAVAGKVLRLVPSLAASGVIFSVLVSKGQGGGDYTNLVGTLWMRLEPLLLDKDLSKSNRDYVYRYLETHSAGLLGEGLGNANVIFGHANASDSVVSFLNLYVNILYSLGYFGLVFLLAILCYPFIFKLMRKARRSDANQVFLWTAYIAWLGIFSAHSEELSVHFGLIYAFVIFATQENSKKAV